MLLPHITYRRDGKNFLTFQRNSDLVIICVDISKRNLTLITAGAKSVNNFIYDNSYNNNNNPSESCSEKDCFLVTLTDVSTT